MKKILEFEIRDKTSRIRNIDRYDKRVVILLPSLGNMPCEQQKEQSGHSYGPAI
jgi:hypothetical protein